MFENIKEKIVYLYLDNKTMTGYVGETKELDVRDNTHKKYDIKYDPKYPGRSALMNNVDPVPLTDLLSEKEAWFVEHSLYEKYKEKGYDMLQKPPHPNLWERNKDKINNCKICDELGCNFTKERLEYIMAVHRVSKLCEGCEKVFYFDSIKHQHIIHFDKLKYCSKSCAVKGRKHPMSGKPGYWSGKKRPEISESNRGRKVSGENNPNASINTVIARTIKFLLFYTTLTHQEIAEGIPGATKDVVDNISSGKSWKDVELHNVRFYND